MSIQKRSFVKMLPVFVAAIAITTIVHGQDMKETYEAFAVQMGGGAQGASGTIEINITRWSSNDERIMLLSTLKEKGHDEFMDALRDQEETGFVQGHGRLARASAFPSTRLRGAWQYIHDSKRTVVLVTDRPIGMREAASASRSRDYDTSVLIMEFPSVDKDAEGSGTLHLALKVRYDEENDRLDLEELGQQSTRLTKIKRRD